MNHLNLPDHIRPEKGPGSLERIDLFYRRAAYGLPLFDREFVRLKILNGGLVTEDDFEIFTVTKDEKGSIRAVSFNSNFYAVVLDTINLQFPLIDYWPCVKIELGGYNEGEYRWQILPHWMSSKYQRKQPREPLVVGYHI